MRTLEEQYYNKIVFGDENFRDIHNGLYLTDNKLCILINDNFFDKVIPKLKELGWNQYEIPVERFGRRIKFEKKFVIPIKRGPTKLENKFEFEKIIIECKQDEEGFYYIPDFMKEEFRENFPTTKNRAELCEIEFKEYTGSYPAWCAGESIFQAGHTKIITYIGGHSITIPKPLKKVESDILKNKNKFYDMGYCCGGCD